MTSLTHEELEQLAVEINMSGEDFQQLEIQSYIFKHGPRMPAVPIIPIPIATQEQEIVVGPTTNNAGPTTNTNNIGPNENTMILASGLSVYPLWAQTQTKRRQQRVS